MNKKELMDQFEAIKLYLERRKDQIFLISRDMDDLADQSNDVYTELHFLASELRKLVGR